MEQAKITEIINGILGLSKVAKFPFLNQLATHFKDLYAEYRIYRNLYEISRGITAEMELHLFLQQTVDLLLTETTAERGMIILLNDDSQIEIVVARDSLQSDIPRPEDEISRNIIQQVTQQKMSICIPDIQQAPQFRRRQSVERLALQTVACVPIVLKKQFLGVLYLDHRQIKDIFTARTIYFLEQAAAQLAMSVANIRAHRSLERQNDSLEQVLRSTYNFEPFIGHHPSIIRILDLVSKVADTDATVLIEGETGTGKELIARALHFNSRRAKKELVAINCGALPESLLESELFGYVKGAFTGANTDKKGKFEVAHGGTIFLDEIGEMQPPLQVKLLRILQSGEYSPVGSEEVRRCDVRVIAATNQDLKKLVSDGKFRNDLYYRLNIVRLILPRLAERRSDILVLANHFLKNYRLKVNKPQLTFSRAVEQYFLNYDFPGNVRELENIIERATILAKGTQIEPEDLNEELRTSFGATRFMPDLTRLSFRDAKIKIIENFERSYLTHALAEAHGVIRQAARLADMDVKNFYNKITRLGIQPGDYK
ncbi:sigma 54-interacting transcriptional regulator [candidate division KSB1 bacterium]|nr:sigma 54-interacting transcriptional regulator [candidate division KSB1 bacterium]